MAVSKDLIAASASPLILSLLSKGDSYGYEIIQKVRELSGGEMEWADGMLYPILHRLEKRGFIKSYFATAENGRRRKYYRLLKEGKKELNEQMRVWTKFHDILQSLARSPRCST